MVGHLHLGRFHLSRTLHLFMRNDMLGRFQKEFGT